MTQVIYVPTANGSYAAYAVPPVVVAPPVFSTSNAVVGFKGSHVPAKGGGTPHKVGFKVA